MTIQECYEKIGEDYQEILSRFGSEAMVKRFAVKFLNDTSFANLKQALQDKDVNEAFRAAHTLKGVCLNLGFNNLYTVSSELTEKLRKGELDGSDELFAKVEEQYKITEYAIGQLQ